MTTLLEDWTGVTTPPVGVTRGQVGHGFVTVTVEPLPVVVTGTKVTGEQVGQSCVTVRGGTRPTVTGGQDGHRLVTVSGGQLGHKDVTVVDPGVGTLELIRVRRVDWEGVTELVLFFKPVDVGGRTPVDTVLLRNFPALVETGGRRPELDCGRPVELEGGRPELPLRRGVEL